MYFLGCILNIYPNEFLFANNLYYTYNVYLL